MIFYHTYTPYDKAKHACTQVNTHVLENNECVLPGMPCHVCVLVCLKACEYAYFVFCGCHFMRSHAVLQFGLHRSYQFHASILSFQDSVVGLITLKRTKCAQCLISWHW
jgi:hypothetical protein